jgi:formamidopyrimidine-DNA glycosylase
MPELPEVESLVRVLRPALRGKHLAEVIVQDRRVLETSPQRLRRGLRGRRIDDVDRRGKWILVTLDSGNSLLIQLRMTGQVRLVPPEGDNHVRLEFHLAEGGRFWYSDTRCLGRVALLRPHDLADRLSPAHQGPDALEITPAELVRRLKATSRNIKSALLDQRVVAGIGNIYADESLHAAGLHPETHANRLSHAEVRRLRRAFRRILRSAIANGGSTLRDGRYQSAQGGNGTYQHRHRVYGREGEPCRRCATPIARKRIHGLINRSSYFCPQCQPPRKT